jgi:hypothetical protein
MNMDKQYSKNEDNCISVGIKIIGEKLWQKNQRHLNTMAH